MHVYRLYFFFFFFGDKNANLNLFCVHTTDRIQDLSLFLFHLSRKELPNNLIAIRRVRVRRLFARVFKYSDSHILTHVRKIQIKILRS